MFQLPPPPVPLTLREMLKDYPELIQELQGDLTDLVSRLSNRPNATPPFERAIWLLEDALDAFYSDARRELEVAEQGGDPAAIARAEAKEEWVDRARRQSYWASDDGLWDYFQAHQRAFE